MSYTSPSPANIAYNGNITTWWVSATNLGSVKGTNVLVNTSISPVNGLKLETWQTDTGTYNIVNGIWTVGTLLPNETKWLKIVTKVQDIGLAPFTLTSTVSGTGIDPNNTNNTKIQTLSSVVTSVTAGAQDDLEACACGNVSLNDTPCNYGVTEYILDVSSVINSTDYSWDETTGAYRFPYDDPTKNITAQYSIWCDTGLGSVEISGPADISIEPLIKDITPFNHTLEKEVGTTLSSEDITAIQLLFPGMSEQEVKDQCWAILRNGDHEFTGGHPVECSPKHEIRTFFECSEEECHTPDCPTCPNSAQGDCPLDVYNKLDLVSGYTPGIGDNVFVTHPNHFAVYRWDGNSWAKWSCGCIHKGGMSEMPYPIGLTITGDTTKTVIITMSDATTLSATFLDNNVNTTYTYEVVGTTIVVTPSIGDPVVLTIPVGEINTASNIGSGEGVFHQKVGVDLEFRTLIEGDGIEFDSDVETIIIKNKCCCDEVDMVLMGHVGVSTALYVDNVDLDNVVWTILTLCTPGPESVNCTPQGVQWLPIHTGGASYPVSGHSNGDLARVKYVDSKGCTHYSNIQEIQYP